jgi:hypothetical protein
MMRMTRPCLGGVLAVGMALFATPAARAEQFTYTTELRVGGITVPDVTTTISPAGLGSASLTVAPLSSAGSIDTGANGAVVPFAKQTADTSQFATIMPVQSATIRVPAVNELTLLMTITDQNSGMFGTLDFVGHSAGSVFTAPAGGGVDRIQIVYTSVVPFPFNQTRSLQLGSTQYDVTLQFPGLVLNSNQLMASSNYQVLVQAVPEPASVALLAAGAVILVGWGRHRRRAKVLGN